MKKLLFYLATLQIVGSVSIFASTGTYTGEDDNPSNRIRFEVVD